MPSRRHTESQLKSFVPLAQTIADVVLSPIAAIAEAIILSSSSRFELEIAIVCGMLRAPKDSFEYDMKDLGVTTQRI